MRKSLFFILLGIIMWHTTTAQETHKEWREGKLSWEDFSEKESKWGDSFLKYNLNFKALDRVKQNDTIFSRTIATSSINREVSWVHPSQKTELLLRYNQLIFDIVELHRRKLQYDLDRSYPYQHQIKLSEIIELCDIEIKRFQIESKQGKDESVIELWEANITEQLEITPNQSRPDMQESKFKYGLEVGYQIGNFIGELGKHFTPYRGLSVGADLSFNKIQLSYMGLRTSSKILQDIDNGAIWVEGIKTSIQESNLSLGYTFIDKRKVRLTPFAGYGSLHFIEIKESKEQIPLKLKSHQTVLGVNFDYKLRSERNFTSFSKKHKRYNAEESFLRTKLHINRANTFNHLPTYSINLTFQYGFYLNHFKLK